MKRRILRSPYLWAVIVSAAMIGAAWVGREHYQPIIAGAPAPEFAYPDLTGRRVSLADFRGRKVVLVNIWATWCPPCRQEMPSMERLYQDLRGEDFEILAVSIDAAFGAKDAFGRPGGDLKAFADTLGLTFTILHDPAGEIQQLYQTTGVPETFLVGKDGIIYKKVAGGTAWDAPENQALVRRLLAQ